VRDLPIAGWLLAALLCYASATVFIRDAWAVQSFHIGVFALFAAALIRSTGRICNTTLLLLLLPLWGIFQLAFRLTSSFADTREAILHWTTLAAIFFIARQIGNLRPARITFLTVFLVFAVALAVLCVLQLFTSQGKVLWTYPTGYSDVFGTFPSYNNYAQFVELALPVALGFVLRSERSAWGYAFAGGVLYASVIGSTSRTGAVLCTAELVVFAIIGLKSRGRVILLALVPAAAMVFTAVVGWERVWERFQQQDPLIVRREFFQAAANMVRHRPIAGYGLGSFPVVADAFAVKDFEVRANHVHNDWLEFAADGGVGFALLILLIFVWRVPAMFRHPWALGILAVMFHACVDYPFPRPAVSGWLFALLGLLPADSQRSRR
jgi:O-antigen ligase